ncbi:TPA: hypothetical protein HA249_00365 [Candidatus Woesearchaeota archaeon]|nr:MAG: hypothetical protein QT07_C0006G0031 [archaeon GW2011_AR16]HIG95331.1 hypothetical protein [Candidatus Woesearchaeota archaeon]HIH47467.1 hypothetical protein [Candidatus Woesearchaeota archaeon]HII88618.1 hypothetical protein [Candidatus Woesearchaeota archaeon]
MVDPNGTLALILEQLVQGIPLAIRKFEVLVGGIFGLYLLFLAMRYFHDRKQLKLLHDIKLEIANLNHNLFAEKKYKNKTNSSNVPAAKRSSR